MAARRPPPHGRRQVEDTLPGTEELTDDLTLRAPAARIVADYVVHNTLPTATSGHSSDTCSLPCGCSVSNSAITCLEWGRKQTTLRRHLATAHGLTPDTYRFRWSLPDKHPTTAPAYAAARSELPKAAGLGHKGGHRRKA
ncbi:MucR family transcriptional regulator [Azospirillum sp. A1-3]|nr:MucR family transcriptional regulator [Azospirillum sp. A1-3]MCM8735451.1 MucR family transcriptional regulator [Azospirillum sp. A1-3]